MKIDYLPPSPALASCISIHCEMSGFGVRCTEAIPALLAQLHIRLAGSAVFRFADGRSVQAPPLALCGPTNGAFEVEFSPDYHFHSIGFLSVGWSLLARLPAIDLADQVLDASLLWPAAATRRVIDLMHEARDARQRSAVLDDFLIAMIRQDDRDVDRRALAVDHWLETDPSMSLDRLMGSLELSARQAGRVSQTMHGASSKLLAIKYRALRAASRITLEGAAGLEIAMADYADQSHLIRDFRRFVGVTPGQFLDKQHIARLTMAGRWHAGARRPLVMWS